MNKKITFLTGMLLLSVLFVSKAFTQNNTIFWTAVDAATISTADLENRIDKPKTEVFFKLDLNAFKNALENATNRKDNLLNSNVVISIPNAQGKLEKYQVFMASVLDEELQNSYPELGSFIGKSISNPSKIVRFSVSNQGIKSITLNDVNGTEYIEQINNNQQIYSVFYRRDLTETSEQFGCDVIDGFVDETELDSSVFSRNANDGNLRTFRLAVATTLPFSTYYINKAGVSQGSTAQKRAAVIAAINDIMTRVNAVFENELSLTMVLVPNNSLIISVTNNSLTSNNNGTLLDESTGFINSGVGEFNYDIGHMLSTNGGGVAYVSQVCQSLKGGGVSGSPSPEGANFEATIMHEMGHQYGSRHTFNGNTGGCTANISPTSAYEPGSGSTIMAYPGLCGAQNVQTTTDLYFHQKSLDAMWLNITQGNSQCATITSTGNSAPEIQLESSSYVIPIGTPYKLDASATDLDNESALTYSWEQYDLGPSGVPSLTTASGPLVRSRFPSTNSFRYIPILSDVVSSGGLTSQWEVLVLVERPINYRITVRDNDTRGSQLAVGNLSLQTRNAGGIFRVTSQNTNGIVYDGGTTQSVVWDVAGTTGSGINTSNVNILLSIDGGETFDIVLAGNTPNDGNETVALPNVDAEQCRIMVEAVDNIFFNVNTRNFQIQEQLSVNDEELASNLKIYPNPNNGTFNVDVASTSGENILVKLYDLRGRILFSDLLENNGKIQTTISVNNLKSGVYLLNVVEGNRMATKKIIIE